MNGIASLFAWQQRQTSSCPEDRVPFYSFVEILDGMGKTSPNTQEKPPDPPIILAGIFRYF